MRSVGTIEPEGMLKGSKAKVRTKIAMTMAQNRVLASSQISRMSPDVGFAITSCFRSGFSMRPGSRGVPADQAIRTVESQAGRVSRSGGGDRAAVTALHGSVPDGMMRGSATASLTGVGMLLYLIVFVGAGI